MNGPEKMMSFGYALIAVIGLLIAVCFGWIWLNILVAPGWQHQIKIPGRGVLMVFMIATVIVLLQVSRKPLYWSGRLPGPFWYIWFVILIIAEVALIAAGNNFFHENNHAEWQAAWTLFIVGAHFLGFAFIFHIRAFRWLAVSMCGVSVLSVLLSIIIGAPQLRTFLSAFGGALSLWLFSGWALCKMYRGRWIG